MTERYDFITENWKFDQERFLLCEGEHDKLFLESLIKFRELPAFQIRTASESNADQIGGWTGFGPSIEGFSPIPGFDNLKGIAIVTDNDTPRTLANLIKKLKKHCYKPTESDRRIGTLADTGKPVIIILIPDENECGNLEDLCLPALYSKWEKSEEKVERYLSSTGALAWKKQHQLSKAKVRSIISGYYETDPHKGFHHLFQKRILPVDHECFNNLSTTLSRFDEIVKDGKF